MIGVLNAEIGSATQPGSGGGGGGISEITSDDDSVTISDPEGPTVDLSVTGTGWPAIDGTGTGNLDAQTADDDTSGYTMQDNGSGGINLTTAGTGGMVLQDGTAAGGITIEEVGGAYIVLSVSGGGTTQGISIEQENVADTVGVFIEDNGIGGVSLTANGQGGIEIQDYTSGGAGLVLYSDQGDVEVEAATGSVEIRIGNGGTGGVNIRDGDHGDGTGVTIQSFGVGGTNIADLGASGITLDISGGTGNIILTGVPAADPHVLGALYTTAGALMVSAG